MGQTLSAKSSSLQTSNITSAESTNLKHLIMKRVRIINYSACQKERLLEGRNIERRGREREKGKEGGGEPIYGFGATSHKKIHVFEL